ncbi:tetratricopeptide repeat protein [Dethiosulfovibrio sp. F2B]|nr:tetratricopeptide repeat protein [Dethiosulfovibrio faecalis]MCF4152406.1 tetratricopeptide repeat protein [Dethiosulfovibrio faecalis]
MGVKSLKKGLKLWLCGILILSATPLWAGVDELRERAQNLYRVQDYRGALTLFDRVLSEKPEDGTSLDFSAWCLRYLGDWKSAEARFDRALAVLPGEEGSWATVGLGETLLGSEAYARAIETFNGAIDLSPQDDELVLRCLKGIAWAQAFLGDRQGFDATVARIRSMDGSEADSLVEDTAQVLSDVEVASAQTKEDPAVEEESKDVIDRQAELAQEAEPKEKASKKAAIWGITLGVSAEEEIAKLESDGIVCYRGDGANQYGVEFSVFEFPDNPLPGFLMKNGEAVFAVEEYKGLVYRVSGLVTYEDTRAPLTWIYSQFAGMVDALSGKYGAPDMVRRYGISLEAAWLVDGYTVWMFASVGLDGSGSLQLSYIDGDVQAELLKDIQEQGENL